MSDDISIPRPVLPSSARTSFTHSYRSRRAGMDRSTKLLLAAAGGLGAVLLVGMGIWTSRSHAPTEVPTIEADTRPIRVKPENPGGMVAIGVGDQAVASGTASDLAPAAEQPDPQALLAQRRAAAPPRIAAPASAPTVTPPVAAIPPAPSTARVAPAPVANGPMVQLAAVESEAGATAEWQRLAHKLPDLLGERRPVVQRTEQGGKAFWRLRTGGFTDVADATQFCKRLRGKGVDCSLANF